MKSGLDDRRFDVFELIQAQPIVVFGNDILLAGFDRVREWGGDAGQDDLTDSLKKWLVCRFGLLKDLEQLAQVLLVCTRVISSSCAQEVFAEFQCLVPKPRPGGYGKKYDASQ